MSDSDFQQAMGDVKPIKQEKRISLHAKVFDDQTLAHRRQSAESAQAAAADPLAGDEHVERLDPLAILSFQRPGVQHGVFKQLRLGKYAIEARLDLHRMSVEQARVAVFQFVRDCLAHDIRCGLITHGKGEGREQQAVLKSCVAHWLPQCAEILAFHSAQKQHGGAGATYIMLKKSERKRQENLELHQRRR